MPKSICVLSGYMAHSFFYPERVLVLQPAGGLQGPALLLLEVDGLWSPVLLISEAGFCPVLTSFLS